MRKFFMYVLTLSLWIIDFGLATWFAFITRTVLFAVPSLFFHPGNWQFPQRAEVMDTVFTLLLGIGLLAFLVITQEYYFKEVQQGDLIERFARITGPILIGIFIVDAVLFFMQGFDPSNWYRLLIILAELGVGIILIITSRKERHQQAKLIE
ncbi:MAG: hypothetical protein ACK2U1_02385 [Anaerolineales bacterium]